MNKLLIFVVLLTIVDISNLAFAVGINPNSVVYIECTSQDGKVYKGSGVIISDEAQILTAKHVVPEGSTCMGVRGTAAAIPNRKLILGKRSSQYDAMILRFVPIHNEKFEPAGYVKITQELQSKTITAHGFPSGGTGQISIRSGVIATTVPDANGWVETVALTTRGMSGGPVTLENGALIGIIIGAKFDNRGTPTDYAILAVQEIANELTLSTSVPRTTRLEISSRDGRSTVVASGSGGGELDKAQENSAEFGSFAQIISSGGEKSECNENSGRTISQVDARVLVGKYEDNGLIFQYRAHAQGGHYRTAVVCAFGEPVGLTGHDTQVSASIISNGIIEFVVAFNRPPRVFWNNMPPKTQLTIDDSDTMEEFRKTSFEGTGSKVLSFLKHGSNYRLSVKLKEQVSHKGAYRPETREGHALIQVTD